MELTSYLDKYKIIGVIANYKCSLPSNKLVKNIITSPKKEKLLIKFNLSIELLDKKFSQLSISEKFKIDLLSKLNEDIIIIGNLSSSLIYRDRMMIIKLLKKLNDNYNKKIIIIDDDMSVLMKICNYFLVLKNKKIVYKTEKIYDDKLYDYCRKPKIVDFIYKANNNNVQLEKYTDVYELIKAIYRSL